MYHFQEALLTLKKLNNLVSENKVLANVLIFQEYNFWQIYQPFIFLDLRNYFKNKNAFLNKKTEETFNVRILLSGSILLIISVISLVFFVLSRRKIIIFSSDIISSKYKSDFRMQGIYEYLLDNNIKFFEIFHTNLGKNTFLNILRRRRPAFYLESIDFIYFWLNVFRAKNKNNQIINDADFNIFGDDKDFAISLILKYSNLIPQSKFRIKTFKKILKYSGAKILLTIDSVRHYNELIAACGQNKIQTYAFQHGQFTKYQIGWLSCSNLKSNLIKPDKLVVWSEYWKNELLRLGTYFRNDELIVGGDPKVEFQFMKEGEVISGDQSRNIGILLPYETESPKEEVSYYIKKILECQNIILYFKPRPGLDLKNQLQSYKILDNEKVKIIHDFPAQQSNVDLVIGTQSTFLYDTIYHLKPVFILRTGSDYAEGMVLNGLAEYLEDSQICEKLNSLKSMSVDLLSNRKSILYGDKILLIKDFLKDILIKSHV